VWGSGLGGGIPQFPLTYIYLYIVSCNGTKKIIFRDVSVVQLNDEDIMLSSKSIKWYQCVVPVASNILKHRNELNKKLNHLIASNSKKELVFLLALFSSENMKELADFYFELCTNLENDNQIVIVYTNQEIFDLFMSSMPHLIGSEYSVKLNCWEEFDTYLKKKTAKEVDGLLVANSSKIGEPITSAIISTYKRFGLDILCINQCDDAKYDKEKSLEFLRGGPPSWEIFRYDDLSQQLPEGTVNPLVQRDLTQKIVAQIKNPVVKKSQVKLFKFLHEPGAGATTIALHVLWSLKKKFRCIRVNALDPSSLRATAEKIFDFYLFGNEGSLSAILVLLDNSSDERASNLRNMLDTLSKDKMLELQPGIRLYTTL